MLAVCKKDCLDQGSMIRLGGEEEYHSHNDGKSSVRNMPHKGRDM